MDFLKENWFKVSFLAVVIVVIGGSFYWFQWRPQKIRIECNDSAFRGSMESLDVSTQTQSGRMDLKYKFYKDCLRYSGIEE